MRPLVLAALLLFLAIGVWRTCVHAEGTTDPPSSSAQEVATEQENVSEDENPDWGAIRKSAEDYVAAYNAGDAGAIGELYAENAELVDAAGTVYRGRDVIREEYAAFFKEHPGATLQMVVENVTFVGPTMAIEDGTTESRLAEEEASSLSRYVAVHVKEGDHWRLASVRDEEVPAEGHGKLEELTWMIGHWVDEAPEAMMAMDFYWHESGAYLMRDFKIQIEGLLAPSATERIGWDPLKQQVRSWFFDSEGGYLEGTWDRRGEEWTVTASGFRADGEPIHATYVVTPLRDDAYHVHSVNRTAGRQELENFEMTVVRRPPAPGETPPLKASAEENPGPDEKQE